MSDKEEANSYHFDDIFSGSHKPSISLDCSYLDDDKEDCADNAAIDYDDKYEDTVRKFSTSKKRIVNEGEERRRSPSRGCVDPPVLYTAVFGSSNTGKTSLCEQLQSCSMTSLGEERSVGRSDVGTLVEVDRWTCR